MTKIVRLPTAYMLTTKGPSLWDDARHPAGQFSLCTQNSGRGQNFFDSAWTIHLNAKMRSVEICAGAGGQAIGLEIAGFEHAALVEIDPHACQTLRYNRPAWNVIEGDVCGFSGHSFKGVDLLAGGVPCPPFSVAGKQLGGNDERDLFPEALRLASEIDPSAIMLENVRGFLSPRFESYRKALRVRLREMGYEMDFRLLNASDFGVPQLRPRVVIVALKNDIWPCFEWPGSLKDSPLTVGQCLSDLMGEMGWPGLAEWVAKANQIAPTVVGGSKKHGGPDLGPTRAKKAWAELGVNGKSIGNEPPGPDHEGMPRLTVKMVARLQGFPDEWVFSGKKTPAYRQVGNAFPPPVAAAVGRKIYQALKSSSQQKTNVA